MLIIDYKINDEEFNDITFIDYIQDEDQAMEKLSELSENALISDNERDLFIYSYLPNECRYYDPEEGILLLNSFFNPTSHIRGLIEKRLKTSEWSQLNDADLTDSKKKEWKDYRDKLRYIQNNLTEDNVFSIILPDEPNNDIYVNCPVQTEVNLKLKEISQQESILRSDTNSTFYSEVLEAETYCDYETRENLRYLIDTHTSGKLSYKYNGTDTVELTLAKLKKLYSEIMDHLMEIKYKKWKIKEETIPSILNKNISDDKKIEQIKNISLTE